MKLLITYTREDHGKDYARHICLDPSDWQGEDGPDRVKAAVLRTYAHPPKARNVTLKSLVRIEGLWTSANVFYLRTEEREVTTVETIGRFTR